jgi:hypothetical protein
LHYCGVFRTNCDRRSATGTQIIAETLEGAIY